MKHAVGQVQQAAVDQQHEHAAAQQQPDRRRRSRRSTQSKPRLNTRKNQPSSAIDRPADEPADDQRRRRRDGPRQTSVGVERQSRQVAGRADACSHGAQKLIAGPARRRAISPSRGSASPCPCRPRLQQQHRQRRAERQRVERRDDRRDGDRQRRTAGRTARRCREMNAQGTNTARQHQADGDHRAGDLVHRLDGRVARRQPVFDVVLDRLDDHDGVVDDDADRQHQAEQRQVVQAEAAARPSTANVPMIATGTAISGMIAARQSCRNTSTTMATRMTASRSVLKTSLIDSSMNGRRVVDDRVVDARRESGPSAPPSSPRPARRFPGRWSRAAGRSTGRPTACRRACRPGRRPARRVRCGRRRCRRTMPAVGVGLER